MKKKLKKLNRNIKDTVFTALFKIPKYKLLLFKALHPKAKDVEEKDIKTITLKTILANGLYNDLGLLVKDKIIFLLEVQSIWSINILLRIYIYLAETYKNIIEEREKNLYGTRKVEIPIPELYVLYLGKNKIKKKEFSLNEEYFDGKGPIDLKVKVITVRSKKDVLKEYIEFAHRFDDFRNSKKKPSEKDIQNFINSCIRDGILKEFLSENKEEVMSIQTMLFDQDYVSEMYDNELFEKGIEQGMEKGIKEGMEKGIKQGIEQGMEKGRIEERNNIIDILVKQGIFTKEEALKKLNYDNDDKK